MKTACDQCEVIERERMHAQAKLTDLCDRIDRLGLRLGVGGEADVVLSQLVYRLDECDLRIQQLRRECLDKSGEIGKLEGKLQNVEARIACRHDRMRPHGRDGDWRIDRCFDCGYEERWLGGFAIEVQRALRKLSGVEELPEYRGGVTVHCQGDGSEDL